MPTVIPSGLHSYHITPEEELHGYAINEFTKAVIQNLLVEAVNQKLALTADQPLSAEHKESYWQQEAYLRGQIEAYQHLLQAAENAEDALRKLESPSSRIPEVSETQPI